MRAMGPLAGKATANSSQRAWLHVHFLPILPTLFEAEGVGEAVLTGTAVTDPNSARDVGELSQQYGESSNFLAAAKGPFFAAPNT